MRLVILLFSSLLLLNCEVHKKEKQLYPLQVGDIAFDSKIDDHNFKICDSLRIKQYYDFSKSHQFKGEKFEIIKIFKQNYKDLNIKGETGYITIRFIVNCKGKTGRFRVEQMGEDYQERIFKDKIIHQLLNIVNSLNGWSATHHFDYYQYLTFKMVDGNLIEILP